MIGDVVAVLISIGGWYLYFNERDRSRDYVTDLLDVVYSEELDRDDLRRSLKHREVQKQLDRWDK